VADLLVTGTDTGVGKTVVAAALVLALRGRGERALGFKPVETGIGPGEPADSEVLAEASGTHEPLAAPLLRLAEALAPAVAAERAGVVLDPVAVEARISALRGTGYRLVVEGAGGVHVPLAWGYTVLELARNRNLEAIVVARAGLGTLNHVVLTVEALRSRGVAVRGVVLNGRGEPPDLAEETNRAALERLLPGLRVAAVPRYREKSSLAVARMAALGMGGLLQPAS